LFTLPPLPPLSERSVPRFLRRIALSTVLLAPLLYFRLRELPFFRGRMGMSGRIDSVVRAMNFSKVRKNVHVRFRISQSDTEIVSQAIVAAVKTIHAAWLGTSCQTTSAKTNSPMLPIAAPAASTLTAFLARSVPRSPSLFFF